MILILYILLVYPFKLSYFKYDTYLAWNLLDYGIDILFFIDLFLNFFTPIFLDNKFIQDHVVLAKHYFKFWFWVDFLSSIPYGLIFGHDELDA
jgi:hypothetical protein